MSSGITKLNMLAITWQSLRAIGRGSSEIYDPGGLKMNKVRRFIKHISDLMSGHDIQMAVVSSEDQITVDWRPLHSADIIVLITAVITA